MRGMHPLRLAFATSFVLAYVASSAGARDWDAHVHHGVAPLLHLNETEVALHHQPTPPSYYTMDWENPEQPESRHPGLIITHALFMSLAFFFFLPIGITMRSLKNSWRGVAVLGFYASFALACGASSVYRKLTPDMYPGSTHASQSYKIFAVALVFLTLIDTLGALRRVVTYIRGAKQYTLKGIVRALWGREDCELGVRPEYIALISEAPESIDNPKESRQSVDAPHSHYAEDFNREDPEQRGNHLRTYSNVSDGTLLDPSSPNFEETQHDITLSPRISLLCRIGRATYSATERALVLAGFAMLLSGIVVYTGGCREKYLNGCLAHLIKGGLFWCYGLISFARFLGWYSERGWAWNRAPSAGYPTAEMVESTVIFLYGATNTWMERFSASPGDPFTTKQIQHIGIAVSHHFSILCMAVESKTVRKWLSTLGTDPSESVSEPEDHTSFNPVPALVISVTGAVMGAHFQTYLFQVQIHALWGNLLVAFGLLRCLTYFFLWIAPVRSTLPSRPPTELLGSFFVTCGGLSFMFSMEEVTLMAMRRGRDDIMTFAITAVAITFLAFNWTIGVVGFHGWLKTRTMRSTLYPSSA
ncbi:hypothetical protein DFH08DRAFT_925527 [Mycena albidolilacea]|uniref:Integral membrane protein n=1 Tax=Mycena albidolilacea TaxID=1033008 RepID=A0AAD6ZSQ0_9AGAR|nr:hypothetical protein DFH08DRAFT_925527 [Mycena albidolilacea]